jgi:hypothetical protein
MRKLLLGLAAASLLLPESKASFTSTVTKKS